MFRPSTLRPLAPALRAAAARRTAAATTSSFHTTARAWIKAGDPLPDMDVLMEGTPGTRVNLAEEAQKTNNMLLIGVPAAFSPACSAKHIPGYVNHPRTKEFESIAVVSVNDVFV